MFWWLGGWGKSGSSRKGSVVAILADSVQIRFFADPTGEFTKMLDMAFDGSAIFGGDRSKRYAIVVEQGKVKSVAVEPDNTGTDVSLAEKVLGAIKP